jgi:hypothetical protein
MRAYTFAQIKMHLGAIEERETRRMQKSAAITAAASLQATMGAALSNNGSFEM